MTKRRKSGVKNLPIDEAKRIGIVDVAQLLDLGAPVRAGREFVVSCPLHDDHHPSCHLNAEKNVWFCHVCQEGGGTIRLVERAKGVTFREAVMAMVQWRRPRT